MLPLFCDPMTLELEGDPDILNTSMYHHTENVAARLRQSKLKAHIFLKYEMSQGQRSKCQQLPITSSISLS